MSLETLTGWLAVILGGGLSLYRYGRLNREYLRDREELPSDRHFAVIYKLLQVSSIAVALLAYSIEHPLLLVLHDSTVLHYLGLVAAVAGVLVFDRAATALGSEYSPCYDLRGSRQLITTGLYGRARHPIYGANLLVLGGLFVSTGSLWLALNAFVVWLYYERSVRSEESYLRARFPEYEAYEARTGRYFPRLMGEKARP